MEEKITISAVHPTARFGELELDGDKVCHLSRNLSCKDG